MNEYKLENESLQLEINRERQTLQDSNVDSFIQRLKDEIERSLQKSTNHDFGVPLDVELKRKIDKLETELKECEQELTCTVHLFIS